MAYLKSNTGIQQIVPNILLMIGIGILLIQIDSKAQNHVRPGDSTKSYLADKIIPSRPEKAAQKLVALLHNKKQFTHVKREHLACFQTSSYEECVQKYTGSVSLDKLQIEFNAYSKVYKHCKKADWPFCVTADTYIGLRITDGCTSVSKMFMAMANEKNLFEDMRLLISKCYTHLEREKDVLGTDNLPKQTISGHQMVLVKWEGVWRLVNITYYKPPKDSSSSPQYDILEKINGKAIIPDSLLYKSICLSTLASTECHKRLVVVAIGEDRNDDMGVRSKVDCLRLATAMPRNTFDNLGQCPVIGLKVYSPCRYHRQKQKKYFSLIGRKLISLNSHSPSVHILNSGDFNEVKISNYVQ